VVRPDFASAYFDIGQREFDLMIKLHTEGHLSSDEWIILALEGRWGLYLSLDKLNEKQKKSLLVELKRRLEILQ